MNESFAELGFKCKKMLGTGQQGQVNRVVCMKGHKQDGVGVELCKRAQGQLGQPSQAIWH